VDGSFWHGHPRAFKPGKSGEYWDKKIRRNMERDQVANAALRDMGWTVIRLWDFEIKTDVGRCVDVIAAAVSTAKQGPSTPGRSPQASPAVRPPPMP
jgi:DNA mismatch endonuclease (patch repair protein)